MRRRSCDVRSRSRVVYAHESDNSTGSRSCSVYIAYFKGLWRYLINITHSIKAYTRSLTNVGWPLQRATAAAAL